MRKYYYIEKNEFWWFGNVADGYAMPFSEKLDYELNFLVNRTYNQVNPLLVSSHGRYIYIEGDCIVSVTCGVITISEASGAIYSGEGYITLKGAYLAAAERFFQRTEAFLPDIVCAVPQYCTWMDMLQSVDQEKVLSYAENIIASGMPPGLLIIDDGWMCDYGDWRFNRKKFPDPKAMISRLHSLGFKVILWVCPFVNKTATDYSRLKKQGALVRASDGETASRVWWNDVSAVLDGTSPASFAWLGEQLDSLMLRCGVDGFKFDAGDAMYYESDDITYTPASPNQQSGLWAEFAMRYKFSELRACVGKGGRAIVQRLSDKRSNWGRKDGLGSLVPNMIQAGLAGYMYCCPDMIGGGNAVDVAGKAFVEDEELFARSCECAALMPMMQFSHSIWNKSGMLSEIAVKYAQLHASLGEYIVSLSRHAAKTFEPMLRNMEYEFPHNGLACINDQFMLGNKYLVAPVVEKGKRKRKVVLPEGYRWLYVPENKFYAAGTAEVDAPLDVLPYFERVKL